MMEELVRGLAYGVAGFILAWLATRLASGWRERSWFSWEMVLCVCFAAAILMVPGPGDRLTGLTASAFLIVVIGWLRKIGLIKGYFVSLAVILLALAAYRFGIRIDYIYSTQAATGLRLGFYAIPVTLLWLLAAARLYEKTDRLPGLSISLTAVSALTFAVAAYMQRQEVVFSAALSLSLAGCSLGMLRGWGDRMQTLSPKGSLLPGFLLGSIAVVGALKNTASLVFLLPLLAMGVPLLNISYPLIYTINQGASSISIDLRRGYLSHLLREAGISDRTVLRLMVLAACYLSLLALIVVRHVAWTLAGKVAFLLVGLAAGGIFFLLVFLLVPRRIIKRLAALDEVSIMDVKISHVTMEEALRRVEEYIGSKQPHMVVTPNAPAIMQAQTDNDLKDILNRADLVTPDGAGVLLASRLLQMPLEDRVAGIDLLTAMCGLAADKGYSVYLLGAGPDIAREAAQKLQEIYPGLIIAGFRDGYFTAAEEADVVDAVRSARPDILFVALGIPRQEKWIDRYKTELNVPVCMGVGGSFDVISGRLKRAPVWMQRSGLEWVYRVAREPKRFVRILCIPQFLLATLLASLRDRARAE